MSIFWLLKCASIATGARSLFLDFARPQMLVKTHFGTAKSVLGETRVELLSLGMQIKFPCSIVVYRF